MKITSEIINNIQPFARPELIREYFNGNPDATQKDCKHGYVLPDRCRYTAHLGCDCGEYPPLKWNPEKGQYEIAGREN